MKHFDTIDALVAGGVPSVSKDDFYRKHLQWGDLVFCCGPRTDPIDLAIDAFTGSRITHVLFAWLPFPDGPWLTLEATLTKGVHVGLLSDYTGGQDGALVLCRRGATLAQNAAILSRAASLVDDKYDWRQEVSFAAHRLLACMPVVHPRGELYCSGLVYTASQPTLPFAYTIDAANPDYPSPEAIFTDPSVAAVCVLTPDAMKPAA